MIDGMLTRGDLERAGEHREVLEAFRMFAHDRGWRRRLDEALLTGLTAEAAVQRVRNDTRARMLRQTDPYARDRLHDIDDLSNRLLRLLAGGMRHGGGRQSAARHHPRRPYHGPGGAPRLRSPALARSGAGGGRRRQPCRHRRARARACRHQPGQGRARSGRARRRGHRRCRSQASCICGRRPKS